MTSLESFLYNIKKYYRYLIPLNVILAAFIVYQIFYSKYDWDGPAEKKFIIEQGKNLDEIITALKKDDIISNSFLFKLSVKLSGKEGDIISRIYVFKNGMSNSDLIDQLTDKDNNRLVRVTIPPGYSIKRMAKLLEKKLNLSADKFIREASNDSLIKLTGYEGKINNLEGFLFPDSYDVSPDISEKGLVQILFNEFRKKVMDNADLRAKIEERETTLLNTLTLASIIEGETLIDQEKPTIAGVYLNRLNKGMKLEADPTVQYALPDGPKSRLLYEDLKINSPYNTYLNKGLPPGPINNPGLASIKAALSPEEHKYIFFVATGEGGHKFSETYDQHLSAIAEYRKKLREKKNNNK